MILGSLQHEHYSLFVRSVGYFEFHNSVRALLFPGTLDLDFLDVDSNDLM